MNNLSVLTELRREQQMKSLMDMPERDLCEMIRAHFASHPTLPGEKMIKDQANQLIAATEQNNTPFDTNKQSLLSSDEKNDLAWQYAKTRIRDTPLKEGIHYLDFRHFDPTALKRNAVTEIADVGGNSIFVDRVNVKLQRNDAGEVYVLAEQSDGAHRMIGTLPEKFLKNNPMNVDSCAAELQVADYSNGNMKNLSAKVVVDTDLMSGDVIDLDENLLDSLEQKNGLEQ